MFKVVEAQHKHAVYIAKNIRQSDKEELIAAGEDNITEAVVNSLSCSAEAFTILKDDEAFLIYGYTPNIENNGAIIWMLCTNEINNSKIFTYKVASNFISTLLKKYPVLYNIIHDKNEKGKEWLKSLHFIITDIPHIISTTSEHFRYFYKEQEGYKKCVA